MRAWGACQTWARRKTDMDDQRDADCNATLEALAQDQDLDPAAREKLDNRVIQILLPATVRHALAENLCDLARRQVSGGLDLSLDTLNGKVTTVRVTLRLGKVR